MSLQAETGVTHDDGKPYGKDTASQHAYPGGDAVVYQENGRRIGADTEECRVAERDLSRVAADNIPADAHRGIQHDHNQKMPGEGVVKDQGECGKSAYKQHKHPETLFHARLTSSP